MSEAKKRKFHTPEFKAKVALEALRGIKTLNEIGQEFGVQELLRTISFSTMLVMLGSVTSITSLIMGFLSLPTRDQRF
jgi:hypothetical protein